MNKELDLKGLPDGDWEDWRKKVDVSLGGQRFEERLVFVNEDGIPIQPLYGAQHPGDPAEPSFPGLAPFRRGGNPLPGWLLISDVDDPSPADALRALTADDRQSVDGVWLTFNSLDRAGEPPTDPDTGSAEELLPRAGQGLSIVDVSDLESLLEPLDLASTRVFLDAGAASMAATGLFLEVARRKGTPWNGLQGGLGIDPAAQLAAFGGDLPRIEKRFEDLGKIAAWCHDTAPGLRAARVDTKVYHDAGASAVEELAFAVAAGVETLRRVGETGLSIPSAASQILFSLCLDSDLFSNIAKLRAARQLWDRALEAWGVAPGSRRMLLRAQGSWRSRTIYARAVNALRGTAETFAAAVGGADLITTSRYDEAAGVGSFFSRRLATQTQHILREECHLDRVQDPVGGSWYAEWLSEETSRRAWALFQEIEAAGGFLAYVADGGLEVRLDGSRDRRRQRVAFRRDPITGISEFPDLEEPPPEAAQDRRPATLDFLRRRWASRGREGGTVAALPRDLVEGAARGRSLADLADFSTPVCATRIERPQAQRDSQPFEALRRRGEALLESQERRPRVFLLNLGSSAETRARSSFARNLLAAGGVEAVASEGFDDPGEAVAAFAESGLSAVVLCGSDAVYPRLVPDLAGRLRDAGAKRVILAGHPGDRELGLRRNGIDSFIFLGCDVLSFLERLYSNLEAAP